MKMSLLAFFWIPLCVMGAGDENVYQRLVRQAVTAMEDDSLQQAEILFHQALKEAPAAQGNALIWGHLASIAERTGREKEALDDYQIALGLSPHTMGLLLGRASLYLKLGREDRALVDYNDVLDLREDHPEALLMRAYIYQRQRKYKEARKDYEQLLRVQPTHEQALIGLALVNDNDRRPQEAMENIHRVVDLFPTHAAGYAIRAGMELDRGQYELAETDFTEAIRLEPKNPQYYLGRARLYSQMKNKRRAREDVREAARLGASAEEVAGAAGIKK